MTVGYTTSTDVLDYLLNMYGEESIAYTSFKALPEDYQTICLANAALQLNILPFIGVYFPAAAAADPTAPTAPSEYEKPPYCIFPRQLCNGEIIQATSLLKWAQAEQVAFAINTGGTGSSSGSAGDSDMRAALQRQGVTSFTIGKLSETYGGSSSSTLGGGSSSINGSLDSTVAPKAVQLLKTFVRTVFPIV